jgi:hypothetical protein
VIGREKVGGFCGSSDFSSLTLDWRTFCASLSEARLHSIPSHANTHTNNILECSLPFAYLSFIQPAEQFGLLR